MQILATFWFRIPRPDPAQQSLHLQAGRRPAAPVFPRTALCAARLADGCIWKPGQGGAADWRAGIQANATAAGETSRHTTQWRAEHVACSYGMNVFWINPYGKENKERKIQLIPGTCTAEIIVCFWKESVTHRDFSGFSNLRRICDRVPRATHHYGWSPEVSMNLQSYAVANRFALWNWKTGGKIFLVKFPTMHFCCKSNSKVSNLTTPLWPVHIVAQNQHTPRGCV